MQLGVYTSQGATCQCSCRSYQAAPGIGWPGLAESCDSRGLWHCDCEPALQPSCHHGVAAEARQLAAHGAAGSRIHLSAALKHRCSAHACMRRGREQALTVGGSAGQAFRLCTASTASKIGTGMLDAVAAAAPAAPLTQHPPEPMHMDTTPKRAALPRRCISYSSVAVWRGGNGATAASVPATQAAD